MRKMTLAHPSIDLKFSRHLPLLNTVLRHRQKKEIGDRKELKHSTVDKVSSSSPPDQQTDKRSLGMDNRPCSPWYLDHACLVNRSDGPKPQKLDPDKLIRRIRGRACRVQWRRLDRGHVSFLATNPAWLPASSSGCGNARAE